MAALQIEQPIPLDWDPTERDASYEALLEWAIVHEPQSEPDWCWAACLTNVLSGLGRFVDQSDVVRGYLTPGADADSYDGIDDARIESAEDMCSLLEAYGFKEPRAHEAALDFAELERRIEDGPLIAEFWHEGETQRHAVVLYGIRRKEGLDEVGVSDPRCLEPRWYPVEALQGPDPLRCSSAYGAGAGEWRRTYLTDGYRAGYVSRFFCHLGDLAHRMDLAGGEIPPQGTPADSRLLFGSDPPDPKWLRRELSLAIASYRFFRHRIRRLPRSELAEPVYLHESIPVCRFRGRLDPAAPLRDQLAFHSWHHQVHDLEGPRFYVQTQWAKEGWRARWIGERPRAERVARAILRLDEEAGQHAGPVRLIWERRLSMLAFWIEAEELFWVAALHSDRDHLMPKDQPIGQERFRELLES